MPEFIVNGEVDNTSNKTSKMIFTSQMGKDFHSGHGKLNDIIEEAYPEIINEYRQNKRFEKKSATQLMLINQGFRGYTSFNQLLTAQDPGGYLAPIYTLDLIESSKSETDIMSYIVSSEVQVPSNILKAPTLDLYSDENKKAVKKMQVAEGAEFGTVSVSFGEMQVNLYKHGARIEATYEAVRNQTLDVVGIALRALGSDISGQNVTAATRTLESKANFVANTTATTGVFTNDDLFKGILAYAARYKIAPTTMLCSQTVFDQIAEMRYDLNSAMGITSSIAINFPTLDLSTLNVIPADVSLKDGKEQILLLNKNNTLTKYTQNGSVLEEYATNIQRQINDVVVSEVSGFGVTVNNIGTIVSK